MDNTFKFLLVSDVHHFSTADLYVGYKNALQKLGIPFEVAPIHELISENNAARLSTDAAWGVTMSKALCVSNNFTHVIVISGLIVPAWFYESLNVYGKKVVVIATDDPHASKVLMDYEKDIHLWCTNEKTLVGDKIRYLPTATDIMYPTCAKSDLPKQYQNDIIFVGTVYKDREKVLEDACEWCEENGKTIRIFGPLLKTSKDSIVRKYAVEGIMNNNEVKMCYRGAECVINIDRNVNWNPMTDEGNPTLIDTGEPYSMNPRAYEVAICRSAQMFVNARKEAHDVFGDNIYYSEYNNVKETLTKIFSEPDNIRLNKINNCFNLVKADHTYISRVRTLMNYLKESTNG